MEHQKLKTQLYRFCLQSRHSGSSPRLYRWWNTTWHAEQSRWWRRWDFLRMLTNVSIHWPWYWIDSRCVWNCSAGFSFDFTLNWSWQPSSSSATYIEEAGVNAFCVLGCRTFFKFVSWPCLEATCPFIVLAAFFHLFFSSFERSVDSKCVENSNTACFLLLYI